MTNMRKNYNFYPVSYSNRKINNMVLFERTCHCRFVQTAIQIRFTVILLPFSYFSSESPSKAENMQSFDVRIGLTIRSNFRLVKVTSWLMIFEQICGRVRCVGLSACIFLKLIHQSLKIGAYQVDHNKRRIWKSSDARAGSLFWRANFNKQAKKADRS